MKQKILADLTQEDDGTITDETKTFAWTVADEAIHRANNYALFMEGQLKTELRGMSVYAVLKNAYQEGFLHGFEHKFDQHNYEEKKEDGNTL